VIVLLVESSIENLPENAISVACFSSGRIAVLDTRCVILHS